MSDDADKQHEQDAKQITRDQPLEIVLNCRFRGESPIRAVHVSVEDHFEYVIDLLEEELKCKLEGFAFWDTVKNNEECVRDNDTYSVFRQMVLDAYMKNGAGNTSEDIILLVENQMDLLQGKSEQRTPVKQPKATESTSTAECLRINELEMLFRQQRGETSTSTSTGHWPSTYPIHAAAEHPDGAALLPTLLSARSHHAINELDGLGRTPLHYAAGCGRDDTCQYLLQRSANLHIADAAAGHTPLHRAAAGGHAAAVAILLARSADPNARAGGGGGSGLTPLMLAAAADASDCVLTLLRAGADAAAACAHGRTALDYAPPDSPSAAAALLRQHLLLSGPHPARRPATPAAAGPARAETPAAASAGGGGGEGAAHAAAVRARCAGLLRRFALELEAAPATAPAADAAAYRRRVDRLQEAVRAVGAAVADLAGGGGSGDGGLPLRRSQV